MRPERLETDADRTAAVAELLRGGGADPGAAPPDGEEGEDGDGGAERGEDGRFAPPAEDPPDDAERPSAERSEPLTVKAIAERLEISPEQVYDLEVATGDGETVRLGELKDAWAGRHAEERETAERSDALEERETALSRDAQRLGGMVQELTRAIGPERLGRVLELQEQNAKQVRAQERAQLLNVLPELQDQAKLEAFRDELIEGLAPYGFKPQDLNIEDHRLVWFARDALRAMRKLKQLRAAPDPVPSAPPRTRSPQGRGGGGGARAAALRQARGGTEADKLRGVSALLSGDG